MVDELIPEVQGEVPPVTELEAPAEVEEVDDSPDPAALKAEIAELEQQKKDAKEAAQKWRKEKATARADFFRAKQEPPPAPAVPEIAGLRPDPDSFSDYNDFVRADNDWAANRAVETKKAQWDREDVEKSNNTAHQEKMVKLQGKIDEGFAKYDDFEEVALAETVPITPMIQEVLAETENPADVAYYLGKNRTECVGIGKMTPIAAARAIARIEAKLESENPAPNTNKTTSAPPPIKPVGSSNTVKKDLEKMNQEEFEAERLAQGARRY
jgi:hypothetical protein